MESLYPASMMAGMTPLHETRLDQVLRRLKGSGARRVLDLGCGAGHLLYRLARERQFEAIVGLESCTHSLLLARNLLSGYLDDASQRLSLISSSYTEAQPSLCGYDAAAMVETIEHLKPGALSAAEQVVFGQMRPRVVYVTTPNREYNSLYGLSPGQLREADHEFEWDRDRFCLWSQGIARRNGYRVMMGGIGDHDPEFGQPTQTAFFIRQE
ncbi:methyltransferase domain-containing protein [Thiohalophilus sp.]|uniref:methyltransferase domain-containing protein n=1 Tax=Thiohalophilus sp. TaxID=3028392 RepID=UPI0039755D92